MDDSFGKFSLNFSNFSITFILNFFVGVALSRHERDGITWHRSIAGSRCGETINFFEFFCKIPCPNLAGGGGTIFGKSRDQNRKTL